MNFLLVTLFVSGHTGRCLGLNIRGKNGDKGATQALEAAILCPAQGLLRATGTGPRAVKGVGSHTTQGRLRPVQCS